MKLPLAVYCTKVNCLTSQMALVVKNSPAKAGDIRDVGLIPGLEDPLKESNATHSSILACRIQRTEEPGGATVHGVAKGRT